MVFETTCEDRSAGETKTKDSSVDTAELSIGALLAKVLRLSLMVFSNNQANFNNTRSTHSGRPNSQSASIPAYAEICCDRATV
jgi:hypothetical protein